MAPDRLRAWRTCSFTSWANRKGSGVDHEAGITTSLSLRRFWAMVVKEFVQMRRDRLTFGMMIGIPLHPAHPLRLCHQLRPEAPARRRAAGRQRAAGPDAALRHSATAATSTSSGRSRPKRKAAHALARGEVQFVINIPENFTRDLLRGDRPTILVEADATDPAATSNAIGLRAYCCSARALQNDSQRSAGLSSAARPGPIDLRVHALYNPEGDHAIQHRAGSDGRGAHDDDGHDHRPGDHARTRARHDGEPAVHAHASGRRSWSARSFPTSSSATSRWG